MIAQSHDMQGGPADKIMSRDNAAEAMEKRKKGEPSQGGKKEREKGEKKGKGRKLNAYNKKKRLDTVGRAIDSTEHNGKR